MLHLKNERLYIEMPHPGEMPNHTYRFERAGFISEIILDGNTWFCTSEPKTLVHPSSGGRGICNELICDCDLEAKVGEYFPKFGVGLLKKDEDAPYLFHKKYEEKAFDIEITQENDSCIRFETKPMPCNGYALRQVKTVSIEGNTLLMQHELENVGEKKIQLREYNHNMFSLDGMAIGPDYELLFSDILPLPEGTLPEAFEGYVQNFEYTDGKIRVRRYTGTASVYEMPPSYLKKTGQFRWILRHKASGVSVEGTDEFDPIQVNLWTVDHVCSVESFKGVTIEPGEKAMWRRRWTFRYDPV